MLIYKNINFLFFLLIAGSSQGQINEKQHLNEKTNLQVEVSNLYSKENAEINRFNQKKHFNLIFHDSGLDTIAYLKACNYYTLYHKLRFADTRRLINFSDKRVSIELYSAKELSLLYRLPIEHFLSADGNVFPDIEFILSGDALKEVMIK